MNKEGFQEFLVDTSRLKLSVVDAFWDSEIFGFPVAQIRDIAVWNQSGAIEDYVQYQEWVKSEGIGLVTCRLPHDKLNESMFLESRGFRFVEMVLHPQLDLLPSLAIPYDGRIRIELADRQDLPQLVGVAENAFGCERYHMDPRIDSRLADKRYGRWVRNSYSHQSQKLLKVVDGNYLIGFFVVECRSDQSVYWHLTAISPELKGRGYGYKVWLAMLRYHQDEGYVSVSTTISARNISVHNLYVKLRFRFKSPEMTFHWIG